MNRKHNIFRVKFTFSAANGLIFALNALYFSFIQLYLEQYHTEKSLGILLSVGPFVSIFAPVLWGILTDKAKYKNTILFVTVAGSAIFYTAISISHEFWYLFFALFLLMFFMSPFNGLIDAVTLEYTTEHKINYGPLRLAGTLGYGFVTLFLTFLIGDNFNVLFIAYLLIAASLCAIVCLMPKVEGHAKKSSKLSLKPIVKDKRLMLYMSVIAVTDFIFGFYLNFFPGYMLGSLEFPEWVWGVNVLLTVLPEVPFFLWFDKIIEKLGVDKIIFIGLALIFARCLVFSSFDSMWTIFATSIFTGVCFAGLRYAVASYINTHVAPELKASGQSFMQGFASWLPRMFAGVLGGFVVSAIGITGGMIVCAAICALMFVAFFILKDKSDFAVSAINVDKDENK